MANIRFGVGTVGGGSAELFGYLVQQARKKEMGALKFAYPAKVGNGVCFLWVGLNNSVDGVAEATYMKENNLDFSYGTTRALLTAALAAHPDASDFYIGGCGITLYIKELMQDFPDAVVYFTKRTNEGADMEAIEFRANAQGYELTEEFKTYMQALNDRLALATENKVEELGYQWTEGNSKVLSEGFALGTTPAEVEGVENTSLNFMENFVHKEVIFLTPTKVAAYRPVFTINPL